MSQRSNKGIKEEKRVSTSFKDIKRPINVYFNCFVQIVGVKSVISLKYSYFHVLVLRGLLFTESLSVLRWVCWGGGGSCETESPWGASERTQTKHGTQRIVSAERDDAQVAVRIRWVSGALPHDPWRHLSGTCSKTPEASVIPPFYYK